jgi:hypothetical protein
LELIGVSPSAPIFAGIKPVSQFYEMVLVRLARLKKLICRPVLPVPMKEHYGFFI